MKVYVTGSEGLIGKEFSAIFDGAKQLCDFKLNTDFRTHAIDTDVTHVLHLAAISRLKDAELDEKNAISINSNSIEKFILDCGKNRKIILISTKEVYGDQIKDVYEYDDLLPKTIYAKTKYDMENKAKEFYKLGFNIIIVRLTTVFGSINDHRSSFIYSTVSKALNNQDITVVDANKLLYPTHIDDVINGLFKIIINDVPVTHRVPIYNLVGSGTTNLNFAKTIVQKTKSHSKINVIEDHKNLYASSPIRTIHNDMKFVDWEERIDEYVDLVKKLEKN